jgi:hypothetical protein
LIPSRNITLHTNPRHLHPALLAPINAMQKAPAFAAAPSPGRTTLALMELLHTSPNLTVAADGTAVTDDGLVVKHVLNAERINTTNEARVDARFVSWQICRLVRRDFNYVVTKSFHKGAGKSKVRAREQLRELMTDIRLQAEFFLDDVGCFPVNPEPNVRVVPLRLFSNFVGGLLRSMMIADKAYGRLNHAFEEGRVSEEDYRAYSRNFEMSWSAIKAFLNNGQSDQSAQELGAAQGIA